jgi:hypothetical protein
VNRSGLGEFLLVAALEKHGVERSKVNFVYLNPPDAAPALAAGKVDAWSMWSPGVDIARFEYKAHDVFLEERDLDFQIDFSSFLTRRAFAEDNPDIVRAFNGAFAIEADWVSTHTREAETLAQAKAGYRDEVRDHLIGLKKQYRLHPVSDKAFPGGTAAGRRLVVGPQDSAGDDQCRQSSCADLNVAEKFQPPLPTLAPKGCTECRIRVYSSYLAGNSWRLRFRSPGLACSARRPSPPRDARQTRFV